MLILHCRNRRCTESVLVHCTSLSNARKDRAMCILLKRTKHLYRPVCCGESILSLPVFGPMAINIRPVHSWLWTRCRVITHVIYTLIDPGFEAQSLPGSDRMNACSYRIQNNKPIIWEWTSLQPTVKTITNPLLFAFYLDVSHSFFYSELWLLWFLPSPTFPSLGHQQKLWWMLELLWRGKLGKVTRSHCGDIRQCFWHISCALRRSEVWLPISVRL
jgi:hypothetical protein